MGAPEIARHEAAAQRNVLLLVDDDALREALADLVEGEGWRALQATNGLDAFDLLGLHGRVEAIVLDLALRTRDARLFRAQQLQRKGLKDASVVVIAQHADDAFGLGADAVIERPIDPDAFLAALPTPTWP